MDGFIAHKFPIVKSPIQVIPWYPIQEYIYIMGHKPMPGAFMKIAYLAEQKICNKDILFPEVMGSPKGQPDFDKSPIIPTTLFHLKEEFESILDRIEEKMDLK